MTNKEKFIKSLGKEELILIIQSYCEKRISCRECPLIELDNCANLSKEEVIQWLESEVEDGQ